MKFPLHRAIERHWREHPPQMVKGLESKGLLSAAIDHAAERTAASESSLIQQGVHPQQAQERMREEWAFLPSEKDVPDLPNGGPEKWLSARTTTSSTEAPNSPAEANEPA